MAVSDDDDPPPPPPPPPSNCVSDATLELARDYYDLNRDRAPGYGRNWRRVLVAFGDIVTDDQVTGFTAAEALAREQLWFGWKPFREALECIEAARQTPPPPATGSADQHRCGQRRHRGLGGVVHRLPRHQRRRLL